MKYFFVFSISFKINVTHFINIIFTMSKYSIFFSLYLNIISLKCTDKNIDLTVFDLCCGNKIIIRKILSSAKGKFRVQGL